MDDRAVVEAVLGGNRDVFAQLVRKYQASLVASACHIIRRRDDAEDLAQEAFVEAFRQLGALREREKFAGWLFTILRSKCLRYLRNRREDLSLEEYGDLPDAPSPHDDGALADALQRLPLADREVLAAHYLQGLDYEEVARALGIEVNAARVRCFRARERLRQFIREADEERARLLMQRAMGILLVGGLSDTFTDRVIQEVKAMQMTAMPHVAAHGHAGRVFRPAKVAPIVTQLIVAGGIVLLVVAGLTTYPFIKRSWKPGRGLPVLAAVAGGVAQQQITPADIQKAVQSVKTIHISGTRYTAGTDSGHRSDNNWVRLKPYASYHESTPIDPATPKAAASMHSIALFTADYVIFYAPDQGNKATITHSPPPIYSDLHFLFPAHFTVIGPDTVAGKPVVLLELTDAQNRDLSGKQNGYTELAVDPTTKLPVRYRLLLPAYLPNGPVVEFVRWNIEYDKTPPTDVFNWQPPAGANVQYCP